MDTPTNSPHDPGDEHQERVYDLMRDKMVAETQRPTRSASEDQMYRIYHVLDHGEIRLLDYMGTDEEIARAAWISTGKNDKQDVSHKEINRILRYMLQNAHTSPFEMCELKFYIQLPIVVARQLVRHRTASLNEFSGRYSEMPDLFYCPAPERIGGKGSVTHQGTGERFLEIEAKHVTDMMALDQRRARENYQSYVGMGVSNELARLNLPLSQYSRWIWKIDLHNLMRLLKLRDHSHAQEEIRVYAEILSHIVQQCFPISHAAYTDFLRDAETFSRSEMEIIEAFNNGRHLDTLALFNGMLKGEKKRLLEKLPRLGLLALKYFLENGGLL